MHLIFFHESGAAVPGLADFFADGIVAILKLVKYECVQLFGVNLALFIEYMCFRQYADNPAYDVEAVGFIFIFDYLTFKG